MKQLKMSIKMAVFFIIVCGLIYPLILTGVGQVTMHKKANGSLIYENGQVVGSALIGQEFNNPKFFQGRPSSINYDCSNNPNSKVALSGGTTYGPHSAALLLKVNHEINKFLVENPTVTRSDLPASLFTESASGLDPDISMQAAEVQVNRIAQNTGLSKEQLNQFIVDSKDGSSSNGTVLINVLELNLHVAKALNMI
ncbi:MAG: potassium-transporting ATPase subunit KdpC [Sarcina sp.]